jgi:hypothetical protein
MCQEKYENASRFIELSKISQEQLWKRRHIEWKTAFALWTAIAVASGFIYRYADRPLPDGWKWLFLFLVFCMFFLITLLHLRHIKAIFISNERDLDFLNFYRDRATSEIDPESPAKNSKYPEWATKKVGVWSSQNEENAFFEKRKDKMRHHYTPVLVTSLIASVSILLLFIMCLEKC